MEPKKQSSYREGRPALRVPQRGADDTTRTSVAPGMTPRRSFLSRLPRIKLSKKFVRIITITIGGLAAAGLLYSVIATNAAKTPDFKTVLPDDKSITELGGWQRISPPKNDPVFAYSDTIGDTTIAISQQPLPKAFAGDVDNQISELAKKFNATNKIESGDTVIYVGTSVKGPQSAILTKNNLLILIKSNATVSDADWARYATTLK